MAVRLAKIAEAIAQVCQFSISFPLSEVFSTELAHLREHQREPVLRRPARLGQQFMRAFNDWITAIANSRVALVETAA